VLLKKITLILLIFCLLVGAGCYADASGTDTLAVKWSDGWYQGADGYNQAIEDYERTNRPMVVYINVGWCPYCRRFEQDVLSSPLVVDFLKDKIKVSINPDHDSREKGIAFKYRIRGFPSFFLHPPQPGRAVQLYTGVTPEEFIELFESAAQ